MADEHITITARCLCKAHTFEAEVSKASLPLRASCCHCNSCRHLTGALYSACARWPSTSEDLSPLQKYAFSASIDVFACKTCSSKLFCRVAATGDTPYVITGSLENIPGLVTYASHMFIGDTVDGGASIWLPKEENGNPVKRWRGHRGSEELPPDWPGPKRPSLDQLNAKPSPDVTPFYCHCKGVQLQLRSGADLGSTPEQVLRGWFVDPKTLKYCGSLECCNSCRLSFGTDLLAWTFAPLSHIDFAGDATTESSQFPQTITDLRQALAAENKDPRLGTLASYNSSPGVDRYFCSTCSASVFYAVHDRPDMVDVAVGLLDHPDGARAEGLLSWMLDRVGWKQDAQDVEGGWRQGLVQTVVSLQQEWADAVRSSAGDVSRQ